ncbi:MAG: hypothetical protein A2156_10395 [Deltaproteobacteria bacterium RBG_16_48_10]|nr:MAG: hypothetical protein A2156_10395 [Deltaproteobacteria bacterium RBG_16_48_10]
MRFKPITIAIILLCLAAGCIAASTAQSQESEYMIKAAFLYNFAKFVDWPDGSFMDDLSPIRLFIIGADPFGDTLDSLKDKTIKARRLTIKRIQKIEEMDKPHILFISSSEKGNVRRIIESLKREPVLTVSEIQEFCQQGGMINFIRLGNKVQFEINPDAVQKKKLVISSRLLNLAKIVGTEIQSGKQ